MPKDAYVELVERSKEITSLASIMGLLYWDQRTTIPPKGHPTRTQHITTLTRIRHAKQTDPRIGELLEKVESDDWTRDPEGVEAVNLREWRHGYDRVIRIPEDLAVALAATTSEAESVWERARPENDWEMFRPHLEKVVTLKRDMAEALGYEREPYDALVDDYERGETAEGIEAVFGRLREPLRNLIDRIQGRASEKDESILAGTYPRDAQERFGRRVAQDIGFDFDAGRLDVSAHPFTAGIGPGDVRITTRYSEDSFQGAFFGVAHEVGHALYHQGLPAEHWGTPFCRPISLGINESQSRMWENMAARSRGFWRHYLPEAREQFSSLKDIAFDDFLRAVNRVKPDLIRVEADEVTYNLHVMVRFEIEIALMRGELFVADLPDAWNEKMKAYLGVVPPDYASGVLQDVHWSLGAVGYFPTYALGNLYAAQFFAKASEELGDMEAMFAKGEFMPLLHWLRENIHSRGSQYLPRDLVKTVTGKDLEPSFLVDYLEQKYGALYSL